MADISSGSSRTEKKKEQIRAAARQLFLQNGFQGTSTDAIMTAAGIASKETLYRYYPGKEELFVDVLRSLTVERPRFHDLMAQTPNPTNFHELETLFKTVIREVLAAMFQPEYLALIRVIMAELPRFPQLGPLFRQTVPQQAMSYLQAVLGEGQRTGLVQKGLDLEVASRMALGALLTYALFDGLFSGEKEPEMPGPGVINSLAANFIKLIAPEDGLR